jgi:hypothetical protein
MLTKLRMCAIQVKLESFTAKYSLSSSFISRNNEWPLICVCMTYYNVVNIYHETITLLNYITKKKILNEANELHGGTLNRMKS